VRGRRKLPYVSGFEDIRGTRRWRFRRKGQASYYFKSAYLSSGFMEEYQACLAGTAAPHVEAGAERTRPGSIDDLVARYYRSPAWQGLTKESSRRTYRGIIERFRQQHGSKPVAGVRVEHLDAILGGMRDTPAAANNLRRVLKRLFAYAMKVGMRADNPALLTDGYKNRSTGFHTWTEDEITQFEAFHSIGSKARLAMALLLWTGQRRSDAIQMGRQHVADGRLRIKQQKTGKVLLVPIAPQLQAVLQQVPAGQMTFLVTQYGKPFTAAGFGNWFRDRCNEAGLPHCSAHGLRKAMSRRLAELGASHSQGKAITGHVTDKEFSRYAADADQVALADQALANLATKLATSGTKTLKRGA
jgi:integrase